MQLGEILYLNSVILTLAGVAQWIENQRVAGSIPSQDTYLDCRPGPQQGALERQPHIDVCLPLSPSLPLSKST